MKKLKKVLEETDSNRIYNVYSKYMYMRTATDYAMEYGGSFGYSRGCDCSMCKSREGHFNSRLTGKTDRSWKKYRKKQWKGV